MDGLMVEWIEGRHYTFKVNFELTQRPYTFKTHTVKKRP